MFCVCSVLIFSIIVFSSDEAPPALSFAFLMLLKAHRKTVNRAARAVSREPPGATAALAAFVPVAEGRAGRDRKITDTVVVHHPSKVCVWVGVPGGVGRLVG